MTAFICFILHFLKNPNPIKCGAFGRLSAVNGSPRRSGLLGVQSVPHHSIEGPEDALRVPLKKGREIFLGREIVFAELKGNMSTIIGNEEGNDAWMR